MGAGNSAMAHNVESQEIRAAQPFPGQQNVAYQQPPRPNVPAIAVPPGDENPLAGQPPTSEPPQTPNSPQQPRSRRGSFSFLRRSKSREISETRKESGGGQRKLSRRKKDRAVSKEEAAATQLKMPPQLPSYHNLPQMNNIPHADGGSNLHPSQLQQQPRSLPIHEGPAPPSAYSTDRPASKSGYDPHAFYRNKLGMSGREPSSSTSREATPTAAGSSPPSAYQDPYARTESMTNRGRYSYGQSSINGSVNSPRRVRRRKDPTPFNVLVVGCKGAGKTSFVDFLTHALTRPSRNRNVVSMNSPKATVKKEQGSLYTSHYLESDMGGERMGVTIYDSAGLEKHLIDLQLRQFSYFLEQKFQETFQEEQKVMRSAGVRDPHIHCVFLILDPSRLDGNINSLKAENNQSGDVINKPRVVGGLDQDLDVDLLKTLQGKTTVIPVISKADSVTTAHMAYLKRIVWDSLKKLKIDPLEILNIESDDEVDENQPASRATPEETEASVKPATSVSSIYDSAREGDEDDSADDSDSTIHKSQGKAKATNGTGVNGTTDKALKPRHDEIRVSTMSENVDLPMLPVSIISPDMHDPSVVGRRFPWGFADPYNTEHCDFTRLLDSVFTEWRDDLREAARERWYEGWRTNRLRTRGTTHASPPNNRTTSGQGRAVSGASAYGGKAPEAALKAPSNSGDSSTVSRAVSTSDVGVAVSTNGAPSTALPTSASVPNAPKSSYRGVGTY